MRRGEKVFDGPSGLWLTPEEVAAQEAERERRRIDLINGLATALNIEERV